MLYKHRHVWCYPRFLISSLNSSVSKSCFSNKFVRFLTARDSKSFKQRLVGDKDLEENSITFSGPRTLYGEDLEDTIYDDDGNNIYRFSHILYIAKYVHNQSYGMKLRIRHRSGIDLEVGKYRFLYVLVVHIPYYSSLLLHGFWIGISIS